jgi:release factor glutamine methyltransferase
MEIFEAPLTVSAAVRAATRILSATSPTPALDAEALVRHASGASRTDLLAHPDRLLDAGACATLAGLVERRRQGEPIAYLTGRREFWSLDLEVSPATLIPRPETELLVERALARIPPSADCTVVDLGTGCGALALAFGRERPGAGVVATDNSKAALAVAARNAERLGIANVAFRSGEWLAPLGRERVQLIASNPPYVRADDPHLREGDLRFEPRAALVGGGDGLDAIRRISAEARAHLLPGGWLLLEHGFEQAGAVRALLSGCGYREVHSYRDLAGHERVTEGCAA